MKKAKIPYFLVLLITLLGTSCEKETLEPTSMTITDITNYVTAGDKAFTFTITLTGSFPDNGYYQVKDASGYLVWSGGFYPWRETISFPVTVYLPPRTMVGPLTVRVSDSPDFISDMKHVRRTNLGIDLERDKFYQELEKGRTYEGHVSAWDSWRGDRVDVMEIPHAVAGDSILVDFNHLIQPGQRGDILLRDSTGLIVYENTDLPLRGNDIVTIPSDGKYFLYILFNETTEFQEHWYYVRWDG